MQEKIEIRLPRLMDAALKEIGRIRPDKLAYRLEMSPLSSASMVIQADGRELLPAVGQFVELYDTPGSLGIFRVTSVTTNYKSGATATVTMEHALTTLSDGVIFGYKEYGGTGVNIKTVLTQLLALQPKEMWVLGACEFTTQFQYSFENENLLRAILSLAEPLTEEYLWTFDTSVFPFVLNLIKAPTGDMSELRMNRNIDSLKVDIDRSELCTRIYPLGYGEGVNQLTIAEVNGGKKYLDADTLATWGVVASTYAETSVTEAATLKSMAQSVLEKLKNPRVTVTVNGDDIFALTGEPLDRFYIGRLCRVPLPDYGILLDERVVSIAKGNVFGDNTRVTLTLANQVRDSVTELVTLSRKAAIGELYSQGSTNQYAVHLADNADQSNPAELSFYIDQDAVWINSVMCRYKLEAFRSYSKGAASGGGSTQTSSSGGGGTSGGGDYSVGDNHTTGDAIGTEQATGYSTGYNTGGTVSGHIHPLKRHWHDISTALSGHIHQVMAHVHQVVFPSHTHALEFGIYRGSAATLATVKIDGNTVPSSAIVNGEFDAVPYLAKDSAGKITRGTWHSISITPNSLTRIVADLHVKTFIRSISGGNY